MRDRTDHFLNFPITMLAGFMEDEKQVLLNVFCFCAYEFYVSCQNVQLVKDFFSISTWNEKNTLAHGEKLSQSTNRKVPWTSLSVNMFWDYYQSNKDDFSKATFLAFLAIKSIVGKRAYYKTSQVRIFKRMAGMTDAFSDKLPDDIAYWCERYKFNRIKDKLQDSFGVTIYANHSRGIYVSTKLDLQKLIEAAERNKLSYRSAKKRHMTEEAYRKAIAVVNSAAPKLST